MHQPSNRIGRWRPVATRDRPPNCHCRDSRCSSERLRPDRHRQLRHPRDTKRERGRADEGDSLDPVAKLGYLFASGTAVGEQDAASARQISALEVARPCGMRMRPCGVACSGPDAPVPRRQTPSPPSRARPPSSRLRCRGSVRPRLDRSEVEPRQGGAPPAVQAPLAQEAASREGPPTAIDSPYRPADTICCTGSACPAECRGTSTHDAASGLLDDPRIPDTDRHRREGGRRLRRCVFTARWIVEARPTDARASIVSRPRMGEAHGNIDFGVARTIGP